MLAEIAAHVKMHGYKKWAPIFAKYSQFSQSTIWRHIRMVKNGEYSDGEMLGSAIKRAKLAQKKAGAALPVAPSPAVLATGGRKASKAIDFMAQIKGLIEDADLLRGFSTKIGDDGKTVIKNPMYFAQAMKLRIGILDLGIRAYQEIYDLRRMEDFYQTIMTVIAEVDPVIRDQIVDKLTELNNERGMTIDAQISGK